jgi:hypothetical protein
MKYCEILGTSDFDQWKEGVKTAKRLGFECPSYEAGSLSEQLKYASFNAHNLVKSMLQFDPDKRISINEIK